MPSVDVFAVLTQARQDTASFKCLKAAVHCSKAASIQGQPRRLQGALHLMCLYHKVAGFGRGWKLKHEDIMGFFLTYQLLEIVFSACINDVRPLSFISHHAASAKMDTSLNTCLREMFR